MTETTSIFHVDCPSCRTSFPVDPAKVPDGGVLARCSECRGVFRVEAPDAMVPTAHAEWAAPAEPAADPITPSPAPPTPAPTPEALSLDPVETTPSPIMEAPAQPATDPLGLPPLDFSVPTPADATPAVSPPETPVFGRRDPKEKARRLARVLVSDMITYNADRHTQALARGTLEADFEDEIGKSWAEYVDQVGAEIAESTPFFTDALNEILAQGKPLF